MVLDTGADISALPKAVVDALTLAGGDRVYEVMAYDNTVRECRTVDYQAVCNRLWELEQQGSLEYETCEARAPGRFDDLPAEHQ